MENKQFISYIIKFIRKIKRHISRTPLGTRFADKIQKIVFKTIFKNPEELFTYYYNTNKWGNNESLSGPGSSLEATKNIRTHLPGLIEELKIKYFFDAPCGDFYWFKLIPIPPEMIYIGGDIVKSTIEVNSKSYSRVNVSFMHIDITCDELPEADIWLCRDVLFHFSNAEISKVLVNLNKSKIKYFLSTTFPDVNLNKDITTGDYRPINLEKEPFNFHPPLKYIEDSDAGHFGKKLGLWEL